MNGGSHIKDVNLSLPKEYNHSQEADLGYISSIPHFVFLYIIVKNNNNLVPKFWGWLLIILVRVSHMNSLSPFYSI